MKGPFSLLEYLQHAPPALPIEPPPNPDPSTSDSEYSATDIRTIGTWNDFNLLNIFQRYNQLPKEASLPRLDLAPTSPPIPINAKFTLVARLYEYVAPRVRRGLRAAFQTMDDTEGLSNITTVCFGIGGQARSVARFTATDPGFAFYLLPSEDEPGPNRAPGTAKPSWNWATAWANSEEEVDRAVHRQGLCQINWYMRQHKKREGFVITDRELVVLRRVDGHNKGTGHLELAAPIRLTTAGTAAQSQLTVPLALWYLGMLSSQDEGNRCWNLSTRSHPHLSLNRRASASTTALLTLMMLSPLR
ncbi:hypothetical protein BDV19DRAFT_166185 [Aspergillus venezuelensis]